MPHFLASVTTDHDQPLDLKGLRWRRFAPKPSPEDVEAVLMDRPFTLHHGGPSLPFQQYGGPGDWLVALPDGGLKIMRQRDPLGERPIPPDMVMQDHYEPQEGFWCANCQRYFDPGLEGSCSAEDEGPFCPECCQAMWGEGDGAEGEAAC